MAASDVIPLTAAGGPNSTEKQNTEMMQEECNTTIGKFRVFVYVVLVARSMY